MKLKTKKRTHKFVKKNKVQKQQHISENKHVIIFWWAAINFLDGCDETFMKFDEIRSVIKSLWNSMKFYICYEFTWSLWNRDEIGLMKTLMKTYLFL